LLAVFVAGGLFLLVVAPALVWLGGPLRGGLGRLSGSALTRIVADPVHAYLSGHAGGLPVDAATLWWTWWACVLLLWVLAALGSFGARWLVLGATVGEAAERVWTGERLGPSPVGRQMMGQRPNVASCSARGFSP
jgi:hypothetical protein